jgi:hypothetical protein
MSEELFQNTVNQLKISGNELPSLYPTPSIRKYTKKSRKAFFEDHNIKTMLFGDSGGGNYSFYLFRDYDNIVYDIYITSSNECYVRYVYEENYTENYSDSDSE